MLTAGWDNTRGRRGDAEVNSNWDYFDESRRWCNRQELRGADNTSCKKIQNQHLLRGAAGKTEDEGMD